MDIATLWEKIGTNRFFSIVLLLLVAIAMTNWLSDPKVTPLKVAKIEGEFRYMKRADLERAIAGVTKGGFFTVDVEVVKKAAEELPWVAKASVRRVWPDALHVWVKEQSPVGWWSENRLINSEGDVFSPQGAKVELKLPYLAGPEGSGKEVIEKYWLANDKLQSLGLSIERMELSKRRAWKVYLDSGEALELGVGEFNRRLRRFVAVYPSIKKKKDKKISTIDMRYANGMAVKWASG